METSAIGSCVATGEALSTSCDRSGATSVVSLTVSEFKFSNSGVTAGSGATSGTGVTSGAGVTSGTRFS